MIEKRPTSQVSESPAYFKKLDSLLDAIFDEADRMRMSNKDIAKSAGLDYKTVLRIQRMQTRYPYFQTVMFLAKAVNMEIKAEKVFRSMRKTG